MDRLTYACEDQKTGKLTVTTLVVYFVVTLFRSNDLTYSTAIGM